VRAIVGPQSEHFSEDEIAAFFSNEYVVGAGSDRMGMRLLGRTLRGGCDLPSDAIAPGSIQIAGDGQPIVLLADRQTTGGYPKIATVISADLPALGRVPIGARIRFERTGLADAERLRRELFAELERIPERVVPLAAANETRSKLHVLNLISGVVDAGSETMLEACS
jgi:allophanate hydrolase subunit 2